VTVELDSDRWDAWHPGEAARRLAGVKAPWCVVAGWGLDLFLGSQRREHEDLEIAIPAAALDAFVDALAGFEVYVVKAPGRGTFTPVAEVSPEGLAETHQTWVRDPASGDWKLDLFRDPSDGDTWICRRDERIRLPYAEVIEWTDDGIPYARPEIVLLFKARHSHLEKNEADFAAALPSLAAAQRRQLREWLDLVHPGHEWLAELS
jgi:hypothetical protein